MEVPHTRSTPRLDLNEESHAELGVPDRIPEPPPLEHSNVSQFQFNWAPSSSSPPPSQPTAAKQKRRRRKKNKTTSSSESDDADSESSDAPSPSTAKETKQRKAPKTLNYADRRKLATLGMARNGNKQTLAQLGAMFDVDASTASKFCKRLEQGESLKDKRRGPPPKWPVAKAMRAIASLAYAQDRSLDATAKAAGIPRKAFVKIRDEVDKRLRSGVADFWFGGLGEEKVLGYIEGAADTICVGISNVTNPRVVEALIRALKREVKVRMMVDWAFACSKSFKCLTLLIEAGIQVCHCSDSYHWNVAVFDEKLLLIGSQSWSDDGLCGAIEECAVVLAGPIVTEFFDKLARQFELAEMDDSEYEKAMAEEKDPDDDGRKRRFDSTTVDKLVAAQV